jgi:hypothetical protein
MLQGNELFVWLSFIFPACSTPLKWEKPDSSETPSMQADG